MTMISTAEFRKMVDIAAATVSIDTDPLKFRAFDDVNKDILACFSPDVPVREQAKFWKQGVVFKNEYSGDPISPYLEVACTFFEAAHPPAVGTGQATDWQRAINLVLENKRWIPNFGMTPVEILKSMEPKSIVLAEAARKLSFLGSSLDVVDGQPVFMDDAPSKLIEEIDRLCGKIGGKFMFAQALREISNKFDTRLGRYHLTRDVSRRTPLEPPKAQMPWGYLIQLAVKHFSDVPSSPDMMSVWNELKELVTAITTLFNLQPYSVFDNLFVKKESIIQDLSKNAQYDSLFSVQQIRTSDLKLMLHGLMGDFKLEHDGITVQSAIKVVEGIVALPNNLTPCGFTSQYLAQSISTSQQSVKQILDKVFIDPPAYKDSPNQNLGFPPSVTECDFGFRPLLHAGADDYVLLSKEICAPAFFEAVLAHGRQVDTGIDDKVGKLAESFLMNEFRKHGVVAITGEYNCGKDKDGKPIEGECDLVVETDDYIILFELKKKSLTRAARSGTDTQIFIDLSKGLVDAQLQLMRHESLLRQFGQFELKHGTTVNVLEWKNRRIERIAVSLLDYGSLQYRRTLQKFLTICCTTDFGTHHSKYQKEFDQLKTKLSELRKMAVELGEFKRSIPFFSAWFLSIPQVLVMLDNVNSNEDLKKEIWRTRHGMFGTEDFYQEYSWLLKTPESQSSP